MTTHPKIKRDIQSLAPGSPKVNLFSLDNTAYGGSVYNFTTETDNGQPLVLNGVTYLPIPVKFTGLELTGEAQLPQPHMIVSNVTKAFLGLVTTGNKGLGAKLTRRKTYAKYLDNGADPDPTAMFAEDIYYIEQVIERTKLSIEWLLVSPFDFGNKMLPKNQIIKYCQRRYRVYRDGAFNYDKATCRYAGANSFTADGVATTSDLDVCGKELSDCELRFPLPQQVPFYGAPGVGQIGRAYR